jgi:hypothetical protein
MTSFAILNFVLLKKRKGIIVVRIISNIARLKAYPAAYKNELSAAWLSNVRCSMSGSLASEQMDIDLKTAG